MYGSNSAVLGEMILESSLVVDSPDNGHLFQILTVIDIYHNSDRQSIGCYLWIISNFDIGVCGCVSLCDTFLYLVPQLLQFQNSNGHFLYYTYRSVVIHIAVNEGEGDKNIEIN